MNSVLKVVTLCASPSMQSKTAALAEIAVSAVQQRYQSEITTINVYRIGAGLTSAITRQDVDDTAEKALTTVEQADLLLVAVPVYRGSYPGMFKHFMDLVDQYALVRKPVVLMATGGSDRHTLVIDHIMRPLFAFFHAFVAPIGIYASSADFDGTTLLNPAIYTRIELAVDDMAPLLTAYPRKSSMSPSSLTQARA